LAAAGIPPAAADLAAIEEDRNFLRRMKKARAPDVANRTASEPSAMPTDGLRDAMI
jgi:hypothetical protein